MERGDVLVQQSGIYTCSSRWHNGRHRRTSNGCGWLQLAGCTIRGRWVQLNGVGNDDHGSSRTDEAGTRQHGGLELSRDSQASWLGESRVRKETASIVLLVQGSIRQRRLGG